VSLRYWARDGSEITMEQWVELLRDFDYKRVALTRLTDDISVSTVWLGMEHAFTFADHDPDYPVHIFETLVFGGTMDGEMWRYGTEAAALDGHADVVEHVRVAYQLTLPDADVERPVRTQEET